MLKGWRNNRGKQCRRATKMKTVLEITKNANATGGKKRRLILFNRQGTFGKLECSRQEYEKTKDKVILFFYFLSNKEEYSNGGNSLLNGKETS